MDPLPLVDDHARLVVAPPEATWRALVAALRGLPAVPGLLAAAWGLDPPTRRGDWTDPAPGDTVPGFAVARADPPRELTLRGRHRFSRYEFRFVLAASGPGTELHARTAAAFPGLLGRGYRLVVIGSGGHAVVVRRLLAQVARRAERPR